MVDDLATMLRWSGHGARPVDWESIEGPLGCRLPDDYRALVERFPWGQYFTFLRVIHPGAFASDDEVVVSMRNLIEDIAEYPEIYREHPQPGDKPFPYAFHTTAGGLLPWGYVGNDFVLCWDTTGPDADTWPTVVCVRALTDWEVFAGTACELITALATGRGEPKLLTYITSAPKRFDPL
jgi:hypothetical protein